MTEADWNAVVNPLPAYEAEIVFEDGSTTTERTVGQTLQEAEVRLQPGWRVPIKVVKLTRVEKLEKSKK